MSRTDKDRPYFIKVKDETLGAFIRHDHRDGYCVVYDGPWWGCRRVSIADRRHDCKKRLEGAWYCNRKTAVRRYRRDWMTGNIIMEGCWKAIQDDDGEIIPGAYEPCHGHRYVSVERWIPCICDDFPPVPNCGYELPSSTATEWYNRPAPKWYRDHTWQNPERVRERDELRKAAALYNAGGYDEDEEFDFDFPNFHHRHMSKWYW